MKSRILLRALLVAIILASIFYFQRNAFAGTNVAGFSDGLPCSGGGPDYRGQMTGSFAVRLDRIGTDTRYSPGFDAAWHAQCLSPSASGALQNLFNILKADIAGGIITKCNASDAVSLDSNGNIKLCSDEADSYITVSGGNWVWSYYDTSDTSDGAAKNNPDGSGYFCTENIIVGASIQGGSNPDPIPAGLDLNACLDLCQSNKAEACGYGWGGNDSDCYCASMHSSPDSNLYVYNYPNVIPYPYDGKRFSGWSYVYPQNTPCLADITNSGGPFKPPQNLPIPNKGLPTDLGQLIAAIFTWSLQIIGLVIFVRFFYAGFLWFTAAGSTDKTSRAKTIMWNAIYGVLVLFSAWLILNTINPDLVGGVLKLPGLPGSQTPAAEEGPPPPSDADTKHGNHAAEVAAAKNALIAATPGRTWTPGLPTQEAFECTRFEITNNAAKLIPGAGILSKPGGNNCQGYSVDIIVFSDGYIYDVMDGTVPDQAGPGWSARGCGTVETNGTCPDRYRQPITYP